MYTIKLAAGVLLMSVVSSTFSALLGEDGLIKNGNNKTTVCYFTNWSGYRKDRAKFRPENINASLCTHINYGFASLDANTLTITMQDPYQDRDNGFYKLVTAFKKQNVTVLISIGGWNDSVNKWRTLIGNPAARTKFVTSAVKFLQDNNFDGLDMDYEYPGCPQGNVSGESAEDNINFNKLLAELKSAFNGKYLLTAATAGGKNLIDKCSNMRQLCELVDWVNVMTYDYHSYLEGQAGAQSPMRGSGAQFGVLETVEYYIQLGCPSDKLVVGINFASKTYTLAQPTAVLPVFGAKTTGPGKIGQYTGSAGFLAYYETCQLLKEGYHQGYSKVNGSYAWQGDQFISFSGDTDIEETCHLIFSHGLRGAMVWALDLDDFNAMCAPTSYPLLTAINKHLMRVSSTSSATNFNLFILTTSFTLLYLY